MQSKEAAALLSFFTLCGLFVAGIAAYAAYDAGATATAAGTFAASAYALTVAAVAKIAGRPAASSVLGTFLLLVGGAVAALAVALLHPTGIRLKPAA